jgi:hypothetical protein
MSHFEHYWKVGKQLKQEWTETPFFVKGEVINIKPPFVVFDSYGIGVDSCLSGTLSIRKTMFTIEVYEKNRPLCKKLMSEFEEQFSNKVVAGYTIGDINELEIQSLKEDLYEGRLNFKIIGV